MEDLIVNTILIFNLQMINKFVSNNYKSEGFGMQKFEDDMSKVSIALVEVFTQSLGIFVESSNLLAQLVDVLSQSTNKWAQSTKGVQDE